MGMCYFDVQLIGGMILYDGKIVEMCIGEGKILVGILLVYFNVLFGKGVYVVMVNDYLVCCDVNWMCLLYEFFGFSVGVVIFFQLLEDKCVVYVVDIIYGINNEFGFDYLCDNMVFSLDDKFQCELNFVVVDEVDLIFIDEVCILLIIFGQVEDSFELYIKINKLILCFKCQVEEVEGKLIEEGYYSIDEKICQVEFNEQGYQFIEDLLSQNGLFGEGESFYLVYNLSLLIYVYVVLCVYILFYCNVEYIVQGDQIFLIDEYIGCIMFGCCLFEGLYQVIEVKEGLLIQVESQILVFIIFQNYFCLYNKLVGMIGIVDIEVFEFCQIYGFDVVVILIYWLIVCKDFNDLVYLIQEEKYVVIIIDIKQCQVFGWLILVGIVLIESFEYVFKLL